MSKHLFFKPSLRLTTITLLFSLAAMLAVPLAATAAGHDKILFTDGNGNIISINPDGSGHTVLGTGGDPKISPDGTKILFTKFEGFSPTTFGPYSDIYTMNTDGTNVVNLTPTNSDPESQPYWSPDGAKIIYTGNGGLFVMDAQGENPHEILAGASNGSFSPDGTKLVFQTTFNDAAEIATSNSDGSNVNLLTTNFGFNGYPAWSPDGTRIVWIANCNCNIPNTITTIHPDGTGRTSILTAPSGGDVTEPAWSPDSQTIIYTAFLGPNGGSPANYRLFFVPSVGGAPTQIYADASGVDTPSWGAFAPADTSAPTLGLPGTITQNATSPQGATITYSVSATDPDNSSDQLTVKCTPPSGSSFSIGTTNVNCSASDPAGNTSQGNFSVVVKGASDQITDLTSSVGVLNLSKGEQNSLDAKLKSASAALSTNDSATVCSSMSDFESQVNAQTGKSIAPRFASQLIAAAKQIRAVSGCS